MAQTVRIEMDQMSSAAKKAGDAVERAREKVTKFDKSVEKTQKRLAKWAKEKYKVLLEVEEQITPVLWALGSSIKILSGRTWNVTMKAVDLATAPLQGISDILKNSVFQMGEAASAAEEMQYKIGDATQELGRMAKSSEKNYNKLTKTIKNALNVSAEMEKTVTEDLTGAGIDGGIVTLAGPDMSGIWDEFTGIGEAFADGLFKSFDFETIRNQLFEAFNTILSNVAELLHGGESSEASSFDSVMGVAENVSTLLSIVSSGMDIGEKLFGPRETAAGSSLIKSIIGSANKGTGILGFGAYRAIDLGAGNLAGGGSLSAGALSAIGLGSTAGAVVGAAGLVHGAMDLYEGFTTENKERAKAYKKAGLVEVVGTLGGAGVGAATGAAIGSIFGGVGAVPGALIGAGIGAIGSWFAGNKIKEDYEKEEAERQKALINQQKAYDVLGMDIDDVKFKTEELNEALHDSETSTEEFAQMYQEAVADNLKKHFGEMTLSLREIQKIAENVVFSKDVKKLQNYSEAAERTSSSQTKFDGSISELNRQNWKVGLGIELDESEKTEYRTAIDNYVEDAESYLENSHYQATLSVELLLGKRGGKGITEDLNSAYSEMNAELHEFTGKYYNMRDSALEDGKIDDEEQKKLSSIQRDILSVTNKVSDAKERASMNSLKTKYSTGHISADSFSSMQEELKARNQSLSQEYENAMQDAFASLDLMKDDISKKEYRKRYKKIQNSYYDKMESLSEDTLNFQFDFLKENYSDELEGMTTEDMKQALENGLVSKPDVSRWSEGDISKWFGLDQLDNLDGETRGAILSVIRGIAHSVPEDQKYVLGEKFKDTVPTVEEIKERIDFTEISALDLFKINKFAFMDQMIPILGQKKDLTAPILTGEEKDFDEQTTQYAERIHGTLEDSRDSEYVQSFNRHYMLDPSQIPLREVIEYDISKATSDPFSTDVNVFLKYNVKTSASDSSDSRGNKNKTDYLPVNLNPMIYADGEYAAGGYANTKQLSWLAEEGYGEWIIPTNPSRRDRALELYKQVGKSLGVEEHAKGGYVSPYGAAFGMRAAGPDSDVGDIPYVSHNGDSGFDKNTTIELNVSVNPEFTVNGAEGENSEDVVGVIRKHIRDLADELGGEIASQLEASFSNRPLKEA